MSQTTRSDTTATCHVEVAANQDGSVVWIAHGSAGGTPFIAEGATKDDALAEAAALVFQCHAARRLIDLLRKSRPDNVRQITRTPPCSA